MSLDNIKLAPYGGPAIYNIYCIQRKVLLYPQKHLGYFPINSKLFWVKLHSLTEKVSYIILHY